MAQGLAGQGAFGRFSTCLTLSIAQLLMSCTEANNGIESFGSELCKLTKLSPQTWRCNEIQDSAPGTCCSQCCMCVSTQASPNSQRMSARHCSDREAEPFLQILPAVVRFKPDLILVSPALMRTARMTSTMPTSGSRRRITSG